ncbi:MAG: hypothetical protein ACK4FZ_10485 [Vogesella sp.]
MAVSEGRRRLTLAELVADLADHDARHRLEIDELLQALDSVGV